MHIINIYKRKVVDDQIGKRERKVEEGIGVLLKVKKMGNPADRMFILVIPWQLPLNSKKEEERQKNCNITER